MQKLNLNLQLGDVVLYRKQIPLIKTSNTNFMQSEPLQSLENLPVDTAALPHYFPRMSVSDELTSTKMVSKDGVLYYVRSSYLNHYIKLSDYDSFDDYLGKFSAKSRSTLKRKVRKAESSGFTYKIYQTVEDVEEFHSNACKVGEQTYQKKLFDAALPNTDAYLQKITKEAEKGHFLGLVLYKDNEPCAYLYCPIADNSYIYAYLGYLPVHSKFSPGTVLQFIALQHIYSSELNAEYFDFTEGDGSHKALFATGYKTCCNILVLEDAFKNNLWLKLQLFTDSFSTKLGQFLDKYDLKNKIKKLIRRKSV